jgi:type I restriction enzyme, S subunit
MIPEDWLNTPIGIVCRSIVPGRNKPKKFDGNIPWITTPNITQKYIYADHARLFVSEEEIKECGGKIVPAGAVIINCVGDFGIIGIAKQKLVINQQLHAFVCPNGLSNEYIYYALSIQTAHMVKVATTTTIPYMNKSSCESIPVFLPPFLEQCRIAEVLGVWDESIDLLERLIGRVRSRKQGLMQQLLTGKKRFKEFEGSEWKDYQLSQIANITMGTSPKSESYNSEKEGLPLLQGNADIKNRVSLPRIWTSEVTKECYPNDILISVRAPVGTVAISLHHACIGRGMASIKAKSKVIPNYLYQLLLFSEPKWASLSQGSTFDSVNSADIKSRIFSIPLMIPEQEKIAAVLSATDEEISTLEKQLAAYKQQKLGLMQQLLTGRIRIGGFKDGQD